MERKGHKLGVAERVQESELRFKTPLSSGRGTVDGREEAQTREQSGATMPGEVAALLQVGVLLGVCCCGRQRS